VSIPINGLPADRVRVGCDVVAIAEIEHSVSLFGDRYLRKMFSAAELEACAGANRIQQLAARFAAKEAVIKAFAAPDEPFAPPEIEVATSGAVPQLRLNGATARLAAQQGWLETTVSLSHADCHAMAVVVVVCAEPGPSR
jgi:holo-[acyl-carrier protein] synthase